MMIVDPEYELRGTGRTTRMLLNAWRQARLGIYTTVVMGSDKEFPYMVDLLQKIVPNVTFERYRRTAKVNGTTIRFVGVSEGVEKIRGTKAGTAFIDHAAWRNICLRDWEYFRWLEVQPYSSSTPHLKKSRLLAIVRDHPVLTKSGQTEKPQAEQLPTEESVPVIGNIFRKAQSSMYLGTERVLWKTLEILSSLRETTWTYFLRVREKRSSGAFDTKPSSLSHGRKP